jgi:hypothetical protein
MHSIQPIFEGVICIAFFIVAMGLTYESCFPSESEDEPFRCSDPHCIFCYPKSEADRGGNAHQRRLARRQDARRKARNA